MLEQWQWIVADFARLYHVDLYDQRGRSWRWFETLVRGLLSIPDSLLRLALKADTGGAPFH